VTVNTKTKLKPKIMQKKVGLVLRQKNTILCILHLTLSIAKILTKSQTKIKNLRYKNCVGFHNAHFEHEYSWIIFLQIIKKSLLNYCLNAEYLPNL
jgi:hypothetical protein